MKELSIEEKAKRYDEALKVLHKYDGANIMFSQSLKEEMFPELKESEDERIRKEIISALKYANHKGVYDKHIAWLERQGEQKVTYTTTMETGDGGINALVTRELPTDGCDDEQNLADKVEPKF
jgi:hypothetical protein